MNQRHNGIVYLSTYPPRECGIATFTHDLATAFNNLYNPITKAHVVALNENQTTHYNYPPLVFSEMAANNIGNYVTLAEHINRDHSIKLIHIQHEFGIFGGECGDYLIPFLQVVKKPVVITFHSVLTKPDDYIRSTVNCISKNARAIVVMNTISKATLEREYAIPQSKLFLIPHGIPHVTFEQPRAAKAALGLSDVVVASTFGMLSKDKGIEYTIRALPQIIRTHPNFLYLVIGATHPHVLAHDGEAYRSMLQKEVENLGIDTHVRFYNKYVSLEEIIQYLKATDIYISAATNPRQSVSGTLSYALGCGRAAVSTPTEYAKHIIKDGENGILVHFRDPASISNAVNNVLADDKKLANMHKNAFESTRHMTWQNVASSYAKLYKTYAHVPTEEKKLPELTLTHMIRLTNSFGIIQHAEYDKPNLRHGYSADDNAHALMVAATYLEKNSDPAVENLLRIYIKFLAFVSRKNGTFANIVNAAKKRDRTSDDDVFGRCFMATGHAAAAASLPEDVKQSAKELFLRSLTHIARISSPRAIAFSIAGLYHYSKNQTDPTMYQDIIATLAERQLSFYQKNSSPHWLWFEDRLTYSNSRLPESLYYAYATTGKQNYIDVAEKTLAFLSSITFEKNQYAPIGESGWYAREKERAYFDQQPEDVSAMVETKLLAFTITHKKQHLNDALTAFQWFLGKNHLEQMVYNETTGGCHDGVCQYSLNLNQGAESTLSYLAARLAFEDEHIKKYIREV